MMETSITPSEFAVLQPVVTQHVDGRGGLAVIVAMALIGLISLRPAPAPTEPSRVALGALGDSEAWMADALPGIGAKTRKAMFHQLRAGHLEALPERARQMARQVFTIPETNQQSPKK